MKILLLSDANSSHTVKWALSLNKQGVNILLFSLFKPNQEIQKRYDEFGITIVEANLQSKISELRRPNLSKLNYILSLRLLKKTIALYQPDILHAHYASSYGVLGYLSRFRPFLLSVWGSDIYDFPEKSIINKWLLKRVINSADKICSTSKAMGNIVSQEYGIPKLEIIPFGIDIHYFKPVGGNQDQFIVGTVKSIEKHNGIDCLLDAAKIIIHDFKINNIKFLIVGDGTELEKMKIKSSELSLDNFVNFEVFISPENVVEYYQKMSIFISVSTRESFGVSILEAASCQVPAITSNVGGLPEVNKHNETGLVIPPESPKELAYAIKKLYNNNALKNTMGKNARNRVKEKFNWNNNVQKMITVYNQATNNK